jgi:hypothetical protein
VLFSAHHSAGLRALTVAHSDAMGTVKATGGPLSETETSGLGKRISENLMKAFDLGERDTSTLERVALQGVFEPARKN